MKCSAWGRNCQEPRIGVSKWCLKHTEAMQKVHQIAQKHENIKKEYRKNHPESESKGGNK